LDGPRSWWERSVGLLPNPTFDVEEVIVAGDPWATRIATRVRIHTTLPDGSLYTRSRPNLRKPCPQRVPKPTK
jgi:hypothetical protein